MNKTKKRLRWNLRHIIPASTFDKLFKETEAMITGFDDFFLKMRPGMSTKQFKSNISFSESVRENINRLSYLAFLMESEDQKSDTARSYKSRARDLEIRIADKSRKISHWLKGMKTPGKQRLGKSHSDRLFSSVPAMKYILTHERSFAPHTLPEREESIICNKDTYGISALNDLRTLLETELEFSFKPASYGKARKIKTQAELVSYIQSPDPDKRKAAYRSLLSAYKKHIDKFFLIYQSVVKDWVYDTRLRNFRSPLSVRNRYNHISDKAVSVLLDVCTNNRKVFWSYFTYKARILNMRKLKRYDLYAPLATRKNRISLDKAVKTVCEALDEFNPAFAEMAYDVIKSRHIDSDPSPKKVSGAFCATVCPSVKPYILLNYTENSRDILVLAHELGHAIHSIYASKQSVSAQNSHLPLAETASTFSEMIVFEKLLDKTESRREKRDLLAEKLADTYATVLRQNYIVKFEIKAHEMFSSGLTPEKLSDIYYDNLREQFGSTIEIDPLFRYEWAYIPHIVHTPFYCYAYNFGELLSLALYSKYKKEGEKVVGIIETILTAGGSRDPGELLKEFGLDIESEEFWQGSFNIVKEWTDRLKNM
ncbi:MAG: M3 family oligoendopeptidase [Elusimicrobiota bacterium]